MKAPRALSLLLLACVVAAALAVPGGRKVAPGNMANAPAAVNGTSAIEPGLQQKAWFTGTCSNGRPTCNQFSVVLRCG